MITELKAPFIVAEIGSNWARYEDNQKNKECALAHIGAAACCGVSAVKFQFFTHRELYGYDKACRYELPKEWLPELKRECDRQEVEFMCSAFSPVGVSIVNPYVNIHKVASAEMLRVDMLDAIKATGKQVIVSTGAADDSMVEKLLFELQRRVFECCILQCVASYPASAKEYNLAFLRELDKRGISHGISDHTDNSLCALVAIGCGAGVFEKHFGLQMVGIEYDSPDDPHSIGYTKLAEYVSDIKSGYEALGDGRKRVMPSEEYLLKSYRRTGVVEQ